jgi:formyltetrahydrofolate deformylase
MHAPLQRAQRTDLANPAAHGERWILTLDCEDRVGIVAGVTGFLAERGGFILDSQQYADVETGRYFMRVSFAGADPTRPLDQATLEREFREVADRFHMHWQLVAESRRPRVMVAVSRTSHCLNDLLHRHRSGQLPIDIAAVVSNHPDLQGLAEWHGVPFHHLPVSPDTRKDQENRLLDLFEQSNADLLVLARYMQVLSPALARALWGRCINIHHAFLPSFPGARPYERAHAAGVKLIGATSHFVSEELDQGPIIEQAVIRVDHRCSVRDLVALGSDIEAQVLSRSVKWWAERRVFLNGSRTVVLS